ncbi:c-type cytochrome [Runella aurantiaca]|uniref:Cytochrome c n=1 Tax=Runella aurantiaca TaxID=2282308 RepID=A0A369I3A1_9BACT|nr:cytochrome c [Runella aurantiaca]RDB04271.1 cytochrome c [Runella aurantiaca]
MKKIVTLLLKAVGVLVAVVGLVLLFVNFRGVPSYEVNIPENIKNVNVEVTPERVARGEKIALVMCNACHANQDNRLVGKHIADLPAEFGKAYSLNITQDGEDGIGSWTDGEIMYFLKTGIKRNGQYAPIMPKFPRMADEDLKSIIAYLHSDRFPVQATKGEGHEQEPSLLLKVLTHTVMKPIEPVTEPILVPDSTDKVAFGKYIANDLIACYACHSGDLAKADPLHPEKSFGFYGGGIKMPDLEGQIVPTANLTFDEETGIAKKYNEEQFVHAVRFCKKPDGSILRYPMQPHITLTDYEVKAIFAYLKTVPQIKNNVNAL